jgi:putative membrane protein
MRRCALWLLALALLPLAGCGLRRAGPVAAPTTPPISAADTGFIKQAAAASEADMQEAQLAVERAGRPVVKQFARQMVADHTSLGQQLSTLAQRKGVATPAQPDAAAASDIQELEQSRRGFDTVYVRVQLAAQEQAVSLFRQEAEQGTDPDVKAFAQQNLPLVQQHLAMAEALDGRPVADRV